MMPLKSLDIRTPWKIRDTGTAYIITDATGRKLAHFYYRRELALRAEYASPEEAKAFAVAFARLSRPDT